MAKNHKWIEQPEFEYGTKPHTCMKCDISKRWHGGDYQAWEYYWTTWSNAIDGSRIPTHHESWKRPECIVKDKI